MKKVTTFNDGRRRTLRSPDDLCKIDKNREALFVFDNGQVFCGYSDGEVDEDGDFAVYRTIYGIALPFSRLIGWCIITQKKYKMMTKIEMQAMDAVIGIHREMKKMNEPDWEQRRYELAKEIFLRRIVHFDTTAIGDDVKDSVAWADRLISELQKGK